MKNHWIKSEYIKIMKKLLLLLSIVLPIFTNCKNSEIESNENFDLQYAYILNNKAISKEEKLNKLTELFVEKYNIKTAISVSVQNENINFYKNYGLTSLSDKNVCTDKTLHYIYSISKTFTSALTLTLIEQNIVDINKTIEYYLPELFSEKYLGTKDLNLYINKDATIKELLNHTSGIYDFAKNSKLYNTSNSIFSEPWNPEYILDYIEYPKEKIGTYIYSSTNYILLGLIIQKATGKKLNSLFEEYFYKPLKISMTYLAPQDELNYSAIAHPHVYPNTDFNLTGDGFTPIDLTKILTPFVYLIGKASWSSGGMVSNASSIAKWGYELYSEKGNAISKHTRNQLYKSIIDINSDKSEVYGYGIRKLFYKDFEFTGTYGRSAGSENLLFYNEMYDTSFCILSNSNMNKKNYPNIDELLFWLFECVKI